MEGMGHTRTGVSLTLVTWGFWVVSLATLAVLMALATGKAGAADINETDLPDLVIMEISNITQVEQGEGSFFNVTIENRGQEAYLKKTMGQLELYGYRDLETEGPSKMTVNYDIYRRTNITVNLKVIFPTIGNHTLRVVVDPSSLVEEENDENNELTVNVTVFEASENRPPEADGGNDRIGYLEQSLLFSGKYSEDPDGDSLTYSWVFGDGAEGSGMITNHIYLFEGQYGASLLVSDGEKVDVDSFTVTIIEAPTNHPPTAVISVPATEVEAKVELTLDGKGSSDPDLDTLRHDWDFDASDGVDDWVRGSSVMNSWSEPGAYIVTLKVSDGKESDTDTVTIIVLEPPPPNQDPQANAGDNLETKKGKEVVLAGEGSDPDGHIVSWEWDLDNDGVYDLYSEINGTLIKTFDETGLHTLWLRVTDNRGGTAKDAVVVTVKKADKDKNDSPGPGLLMALLALALIHIIKRQGPLGSTGYRTKNEKDELTIK